ncbi:MAG: hypothetical protein D5S00_04080 [Tindallia sp. MSAO_Bac2]|nr:MAG: hypothetical protein D5S00_04080 [Tindallia sp. MSAO_Bac2]
MTRLTKKQQAQHQSFSNQSTGAHHTKGESVSSPGKTYQSIVDSDFSTMNYFGTGSIKSEW